MTLDSLSVRTSPGGEVISHSGHSRWRQGVDRRCSPAMGAMECPEVRQRVSSDTMRCRNSEHRRTFIEGSRSWSPARNDRARQTSPGSALHPTRVSPGAPSLLTVLRCNGEPKPYGEFGSGTAVLRGSSGR